MPQMQAGLRYVGDDQPGIRRIRRGAGFIYVMPSGKRLLDQVQGAGRNARPWRNGNA